LDAETLARKRFKPVEKVLAKREQIARKLVEARARVGELQAALPEAEANDRAARGRAIADGRIAPRESEKERISAEIEKTQQQVDDFLAAGELVERDLSELLEANREGWSKAQEREVAQARNAVLTAVQEVAVAVEKLGAENALRAWIDPVPPEGSVDPYGGRLSHSGALGAALDQVRAAVEALASGEEYGKPPPEPEPSWVERRLAAKAKPGWGG
jgi:chromosome segregation ATPase